VFDVGYGELPSFRSGAPSRVGSLDTTVRSRNNSLPQQQQQQQHQQRSTGGGGRKLVYTEFVYYDRDGTARDVQIAGDWCGWTCAPLTCEAERLWKGVFVVPVGYNEFLFYVNGVACVSDTHPRTADGTINWRSVAGPRKPKQETSISKHRDALRSLFASVTSALTRSSSSSLLGLADATTSSRSRTPFDVDISDVSSTISSSSSSEADEEGQYIPSAMLEKSVVERQPSKMSMQSLRPGLYLAAFLAIYLIIYASTLTKLR